MGLHCAQMSLSSSEDGVCNRAGEHARRRDGDLHKKGDRQGDGNGDPD